MDVQAGIFQDPDDLQGPAAPAPFPADADSIVGPAPTVVVAEDDDDTAALIERILNREGLHVLRARDGWHTVKLLREISRPDLAILDINMPFFDGHHLISFIRGRQGWEGLPVLMLTADGSRKAISTALGLGATDYFLKPFKPSELAARVNRLLGRAVEPVSPPAATGT